ncbi:YgaP family membrane protein [Bacillus suaedae]|uniref:DUF2892 domain-containing protein n=1 Tax=Halalkalibacter suaedae TaxID=2822140 RepID=A0A940X0C3_9BACI|nr:DUF2892 domain-containing protein [Bacillus suaedae]MBP3952575.1 DUF2892 domain-containing protein [Bacillus suaedae]
MKPNIGRIDSYCRITMGFTMLAWSTAKLSGKSDPAMPLLMAMCGGMKVAEGITRFCPLVYMAEHKVKNMVDDVNGNEESTQEMNH